MTSPYKMNVVSINTIDRPNEFGETAIESAPHIYLNNNKSAVPQQFLRTCQSLKTLEAIVAKISIPENFILFVGKENDFLYLQAGVIGQDNYTRTHTPNRSNGGPQSHKIVYGRCWLIESSTPTSEVVQTAFLAVKKAREHEIREKIFFRDKNCKSATPFNTHLDLPLMAEHAELFTKTDDTEICIESALSKIKVSNLSLQLLTPPIILAGMIVISIALRKNENHNETHFPELVDKQLVLTLEKLNQAQLWHGVMNELIRLSDRFIEERFSFKGFYRFSQSVDPAALAAFSVNTRKIPSNDGSFSASYAKLTYDVDSKRAPYFSSGVLGEQQHKKIEPFGDLSGHLPKKRK